ncbi:hypothetical protein ACMD2_21259 [Ananas comosus]|uniref:Autophagy-related protein 11 C-terminal domain-containing protein n=1 Tax=Ananas comosus TaxID=4615 RepID=A0A199V0F6_ANACO|nr:hypothetical protein ACMD2_21259 [Ananas comosus]
MISFGHFAAHDLAAFVWNSTGTCEAINRDCSKYSLSEESIALLAGKQSSRPLYIIGKVVHIERRIAGPLVSPRPDLPVGCVLFSSICCANFKCDSKSTIDSGSGLRLADSFVV